MFCCKYYLIIFKKLKALTIHVYALWTFDENNTQKYDFISYPISFTSTAVCAIQTLCFQTSWPQIIFGLIQGSGNMLSKSPENKYFQLCGPRIHLLHCYRSKTTVVNSYFHVCVPIKLYLQKTVCGPDLVYKS